jgi:Arc/MetJ family transcription regulator
MSAPVIPFAPGAEKLIPAILDSVTADGPTKAAVAELLTQVLRQDVPRDQASARLESLIGASTPLRDLQQMRKSEMAIQPPIAREISVPGFRKQKSKWFKEEDDKLLAAVQQHGTDNWPMIASIVGGGRTRSQCSQRWQRGIGPKLTKANWSREEEERLLAAVEAHGNKAWTRIAADMGNRSDVQCRFRYRFLCQKAKQANGPVQPISPPMAVAHLMPEIITIPEND